MEQQISTREQLTEIMHTNRITFSALAKDIGIAMNTLMGFVRDEKMVQFRTFSKIQDYVIKSIK